MSFVTRAMMQARNNRANRQTLWGRWAKRLMQRRNLFGAIGAAAAAKSVSSLSGRSSSYGGGPTTYGGSASKPYSRQYRYKRMSSKKRRYYARKTRSFKNMFTKASGVANQKAMFNSSVQGTSAAGAQVFNALHLYSYSSTATPTIDSGVRDLAQIMNSMSNTIYTDDVTSASKFNFHYGIMDFTVRNASDTSIEMDVYEIDYKDEVEYASWSALMLGANVRQNSLTSSSGDALTLTKRGVTLFDMPALISMAGLKILSKEKVFLNPNESFQKTIKNKTRFSMSKDDVTSDNLYYARRGRTRTVLIVAKSTDATATASIKCGCTRTYGWHVEGQTVPGSALLAD